MDSVLDCCKAFLEWMHCLLQLLDVIGCICFYLKWIEKRPTHAVVKSDAVFVQEYESCPTAQSDSQCNKRTYTNNTFPFLVHFFHPSDPYYDAETVPLETLSFAAETAAPTYVKRGWGRFSFFAGFHIITL